MRIMSLNVNQFLVLRLVGGSWVEKIIEKVKDFLRENPDGIVFLYEIPMRFFSLSSELDEVFKPYMVKKPHARGYGNGFTIAIINNQCGCGWNQVPQKSAFFVAYFQNRYIEFEHSSGLRVLAIHTPGKFGFLQSLGDYAEKLKDENFIILGDFNIATDRWRTKEREDELKNAIQERNNKKIEDCKDFFNRQNWLKLDMYQIGYIDTVGTDNPTYFWESMTKEGTWEKKSTTIDHVLASPSLEGRVTAKVFSQEELELSDHAVIIVDVNL